MTTTITHSWFIMQRQLRNLARQPAYIAFTIVSPAIYLLLFGALFKKVVDLPGFGADSYINFLTPGIVVMSALYSAGWSGMGVIQDLDRGVLDRFLVSPASRSSLIIGRLTQMAVVTIIQSVIIIGLGLLVGARFPDGGIGLLALVLSAVLLAAPFGALSCAAALMARKEESVIAAVNFVLLPLTFLSSVFMSEKLMPHWMQKVALFNPVNWSVQAGREALSSNADWSIVFTHLGYLVIFALVCAWLATQAFRSYQRSA
ncbi:MAG TPA: ABC transporter permease [Nitrolancea sp.]